MASQPHVRIVGRVLIVDDESPARSAYARDLEIDGHQVEAAESAEEALALVRSAPPDAILLDLKMPFASGLGFLYRLRETHPSIPVAILTGLAEVDDDARDEIRSLGAELYHKPIRMTELQRIVRQLLMKAALATHVGNRLRVTFVDGMTQAVDIASVDDEGFLHSGADGTEPGTYWTRFDSVTKLVRLKGL